ncbi:hypothetical protein [Paenibacillus sp. KS-LC4]|uniref:hypothetical protein n=1 Tax=Paenibacillus sp. KS-LC4 TaxID=2979727 RepID=UPI0030CD795B
MLASLQSLYAQTQHMVEQIQETSYEELVQLIDVRTEVLCALQQAEVSEEMKTVIRLIGEYDNILLERMHFLMGEASSGLNRMKTHRLQKQKYEQAYTSESYFVDYKE